MLFRVLGWGWGICLTPSLEADLAGRCRTFDPGRLVPRKSNADAGRVPPRPSNAPLPNRQTAHRPPAELRPRKVVRTATTRNGPMKALNHIAGFFSACSAEARLGFVPQTCYARCAAT